MKASSNLLRTTEIKAKSFWITVQIRIIQHRCEVHDAEPPMDWRVYGILSHSLTKESKKWANVVFNLAMKSFRDTSPSPVEPVNFGEIGYRIGACGAVTLVAIIQCQLGQ